MAFSYYRQIVIDKTKVPNTNQTNFPVLVSGTYTYLKTSGNGGNVQNASGYDIGFYSDSGLTTKLKWETDKYVATTGEVVYWVKVPTVSTSVDTVIYMAYGDAGITTDQSDKTNVWDVAVKGVYHFGDGTTLSLTDSTSNAKNGTNVGTATAVAGQIGGAVNLNGTSQYVTAASLQVSALTTFSVSAWVKPNGTQITNSCIVVDAYTASSVNYALLFDRVSGPSLRAFGGFFNGAWRESPSVTLTDGVWAKLTVTYDGSTIRLYKDNAAAVTTSYSGTPTTDNSSLIIGKRWDGTTDLVKGGIDEVRVQSGVLSADWITTEYNNQNSPSTFYTVGSENATATNTYTPGFFGAAW